MAKEKILKDEVMSESELDGVAGGGLTDTVRDGLQLYLRGKLSFEQVKDASLIAKTLHDMGYSGYKQTGLWEDNVYTDRNGNTLSGPDFWKKFGEENGAAVLKDRESTLDEGLLGIANITAY